MCPTNTSLKKVPEIAAEAVNPRLCSHTHNSILFGAPEKTQRVERRRTEIPGGPASVSSLQFARRDAFLAPLTHNPLHSRRCLAPSERQTDARCLCRMHEQGGQRSEWLRHEARLKTVRAAAAPIRRTKHEGIYKLRPLPVLLGDLWLPRRDPSGMVR